MKRPPLGGFLLPVIRGDCQQIKVLQCHVMVIKKRAAYL
uniref:Uncharacterized protein n=1 Tax=Vibrio vulnificus TaxID=672 RepID=A0AAI8ZLD9_VIBVL|nr:hypothetical protein [Vibrio vulnificus]